MRKNFPNNNNNNNTNNTNQKVYNKKSWLIKSPTVYQKKKTDPLIGCKTTPRYMNNYDNDLTLTADTTYSKKLTYDGDSTLNNTMNNFYNDNFGNFQDYNYSNTNYNNFNMNFSNDRNNKNAILNIEDILMLSDKYMSILNSIKNGIESSNECFEWWNFYFNSSLCNQFSKYFIVEKNKKIVEYSNNLELFSIILIYDLSFYPNLYKYMCSTLL